jgi:hypothetical protein
MKSHERHANNVSRERIESIERLIRWIAPHTLGRDRVVQQWVAVKKARRETRRLHEALCLLSRELAELYPASSVINLARRRVRDAVLTLAHA